MLMYLWNHEKQEWEPRQVCRGKWRRQYQCGQRTYICTPDYRSLVLSEWEWHYTLQRPFLGNLDGFFHDIPVGLPQWATFTQEFTLDRTYSWNDLALRNIIPLNTEDFNAGRYRSDDVDVPDLSFGDITCRYNFISIKHDYVGRRSDGSIEWFTDGIVYDISIEWIFFRPRILACGLIPILAAFGLGGLIGLMLAAGGAAAVAAIAAAAAATSSSGNSNNNSSSNNRQKERKS